MSGNIMNSDAVMAFNFLVSPMAKAYAGDVAAFVVGRSAWFGHKRDPVRSLAAHEAGHAIVMPLCGYVPKEVRIDCGGERWEWAGYCDNGWRDSGFSGERLMDSLPVVLGFLVPALAGTVADILDRERASDGPDERGRVLGACLLGAHEIGLSVYLCHYIEMQFGLSAVTALRATVALCASAVADHEPQYAELVGTLVSKRHIGQDTLASLLNPLFKDDLTKRWLEHAQQPQATFIELERFVVFGGFLARAAAETYGTPRAEFAHSPRATDDQQSEPQS